MLPACQRLQSLHSVWIENVKPFFSCEKKGFLFAFVESVSTTCRRLAYALSTVREAVTLELLYDAFIVYFVVEVTDEGVYVNE